MNSWRYKYVEVKDFDVKSGINKLIFQTILVSVISMLADPNDESPANIDAAKMWREDRQNFKKRVAKTVRQSQEDL